VWNTERLHLWSAQIQLRGMRISALIPNSEVILVPFEADLQVVILGDELKDWEMSDLPTRRDRLQEIEA
jgi:hypothetical protein